MKVIACEICGLVQQLPVLTRGQVAKCNRCETSLPRHRVNSRRRTAAFSLAALCLYVPANIYPMLTMEYLGRRTENTVWGGVRGLFEQGMWGVAALIFAASILIPLLKLAGLFFLVIYQGEQWHKTRTWVYRIIAKIGPWAMLDVFLLSVIVALIRFGRFATVIPGPGIVAFTAVVCLTILASGSFDSRLIWKEDSFETNE